MTNDDWPVLDSKAWAETRATLHMWTQIAGKIRLALAPHVNHWWSVGLHVNARGLTTSPIPCGDRVFEVKFDFLDHLLIIDTCDGRRRTVELAPRTVADFYAAVKRALDELEIPVKIWPMPQEVPDPIRFDADRVHSAYDADAARRWWTALYLVDSVFAEFRARFIGKCSPTLFWWGGFDLAVTRFNGKRATVVPEDRMEREAYSHEVISAGFWPGSGTMPEPAFFSYAKPEPAGFKDARVAPSATFYNRDLNMFLLPYEEVRRTSSPRATLLDFLQSTYEAAANLAHWNRAELERATQFE
jgi:hypothetical protein